MAVGAGVQRCALRHHDRMRAVNSGLPVVRLTTMFACPGSPSHFRLAPACHSDRVATNEIVELGRGSASLTDTVSHAVVSLCLRDRLALPPRRLAARPDRPGAPSKRLAARPN